VPAIRALASLFRGRLALICDQHVHASLLSEIDFRQVAEAPMTRNVPDWTREFDAAGVARAIGPSDLFISLVPWCSRSLEQLLRRLNPEGSIGFFPSFRCQVELNFRQHAADLAFDIPRALDKSLGIDDYAAPLRLTPAAWRSAKHIRQAVPPTYRVLVVHADTGPAKMWPAERFVAVLDSFLDRHLDFVALLIGSCSQLLDRGRHAARIVPCYGLTLESALAVVGLADMFLGVDSCMLHAADLYRVPGVGLFGDSSPVEFGFRFSENSVMCVGTSMHAIAVSSVLHALGTLAPKRPTMFRVTATRRAPHRRAINSGMCERPGV
jgi:glycosyl transferase family 9 (putative heptosyltransferase)